MKKNFYIFLFLLLPLFHYAQYSTQDEVGLPLIKNFSPKEYKAFSQNWGFVQDSRGVLYFANGDGVLEFDGVHWRVIKIANDYTARSLAIDSNNRIYVGSTSEFGYLAPDKFSRMKYVSLINKLEENDRKFDYIRNIISVNDGIYFIAGDKLFRWYKNNIKSWYVGKYCNCYKFGDNVLIWHNSVGLKILRKDTIVKVNGGEFFAGINIQNILPYKNNSMLVVSADSGMYVVSDLFNLKKWQYPLITKFYNEVNYFIILNKLLNSAILSGGYYAFATMRGGTAIMNSNGKLIQVLDKEAGVQNETHNSVGQDMQNALWLTLDNGITRADISSPLSFWNDNIGLKGSVLSITRFKGKIYAGTWQGLFYYNFLPESYFSSDNFETNILRFEPLYGIKTTTWDLIVIKNEQNYGNDKLIAATSSGIYEVDSNSAKLIVKGSASKLYRSETNPSLIFASMDDGIKCISIDYSKKNIILKDEGKLKGFDDRVVNFGEDADCKIWISTEFSGVYSLEFNNWVSNESGLPLYEKSYFFKHYTLADGLPKNYCTIYKIRNMNVFISEDGIYLPLKSSKGNKIKFVKDNSYFSYIQNKSVFINYLTEDKKGNIWLQITNKEIGKKTLFEAVLLKNGYYNIKINPFKPIPDMEVYSIFPEDNNITWFGGDDGLVKYGGDIKFNYKQAFHALIRKVTLDRDSVLFGGTFYKEINGNGECVGLDFIQPKEMKPKVAFAYNSLTFEFSASSYFDEASKVYKIFLEGFDKKWSDWTNESKKEYTNLPPGNYKFHVIAKNIFDTQSDETVYEFRILAPWYRTWLAYILYFIMIGFIVFSIIRFSNKRLREAKIKLEELVTERTNEINEQIKVIEKEKEKSDKLLLNTLPFKIAEELKANGSAKTKFFDQVTVLFSDFKGFTVIAQQLEGQELIAELNRCFVFFDDVCVRHNVEKIKTMGDSYMCAGGVPIKNKTNPVDIILAAFEIRDYISRLKKEQYDKGMTLWKIRIGVHTGPIISGVVGKKKFAYDIWGDTVNTASRLEQTSFPNKINISGDTYNLIKDFFDCIYRGKIPVKHKGEIDMYFAERIKKELCIDDEGRIPNQAFWDLYEKLNE